MKILRFVTRLVVLAIFYLFYEIKNLEDPFIYRLGVELGFERLVLFILFLICLLIRRTADLIDEEEKYKLNKNSVLMWLRFSWFEYWFYAISFFIIIANLKLQGGSYLPYAINMVDAIYNLMSK